MKRIRGLLIGYVVIALGTGWPIASVLIASLVAGRYGCRVDEGSVHPCLVNGSDIGGTLYTMGMMGWFMLATLPLGAILFVVWTLLWFLVIARRRQAAA